MQNTFDEAFSLVTKLVADFDARRDYFMASSYKEAQARKDFIDKFWSALGWDVDHVTQTNPYEQEVKVEVPGEGEAIGRSADYAFYVAPNFRDVRFFVEAKKPSVKLKTADNYFQTLRYGWAGGPLSVLTDFEEMHILDCRFKPDIDSALNGWSKVYYYSDYAKRDKFAEIFFLFGRDSVLDGSIEKFAAEHLPKRSGGKQRGLFHGGAISLDEDFLNTLDEFRTALARSFIQENPQLDAEALTEATQRVIDRLVFMRFLEDKLIEPERLISNFGNKGTHWQDFVAQSRRLDRIYNGIIFKNHFIDRTDLRIDDGVFGNLCDELASNYSPYNFNTIPIHILGSIYERFLGKIIEIEGADARLTLKPEVRKAGGVYYTPEYIVRYIVQQTVGPLLENKTPEDLMTAQGSLKIADIACGSGSFLLGVYDFLLNFCAGFYNKKSNRARARKAGCIERDGLFHLSLYQRRELLLNNVYGVDIDAQAVEVAQLSLFLKLLEEETTASAREHQRALPGALLPSLDSNIKCGNSLIGRDIIAPIAERRSINPMNFTDAFPKIMKQGGFDAIVGNPPWVDIKGMDNIQVRYFFSRYSTVENRMNIYAVFIDKAINLLQKEGRLGYITPSSFLTQSSYTKLRDSLTTYQIECIVRTPDKVFLGVVAETAIFLLTKISATGKTHTVVFAPDSILTEVDEKVATQVRDIDQATWLANDSKIINFHSGTESQGIISKMEKLGEKLEEVCEFSLGLTPYDKYKGHTEQQIKNREFHSTTRLTENHKPLLEGSDINRYLTGLGGAEYIHYGSWLGAPRQQRFFMEPRILVRQIVSGKPPRIYATFTEQ